MIRSVNDNPTPRQAASSVWLQQHPYVDIHCHCLAGIDDGPPAMADAIALCRALVVDSVATVIATPHQLGRYNDCNQAVHIRQKVSQLNEQLKHTGLPLTVVPGADVRVDERICWLLENDKILTLADGGKYILLELPHQIFIDIEPLLVELGSLGVRAIISHPERHSVLVVRPELLNKWLLEHSATVQLTAGSLLGQFGPAAQKAAWHLLSSGLASLVATDSLDLDGRRPCMSAAFKCISNQLSPTIAHRVCIENPSRVLHGRDLEVGAPALHSVNIRRWHREPVPDKY